MSAIPADLKHIGGLKHAPITEHSPGVYFLVLQSKVVYVGQSRQPRARVSFHTQEGTKKFDDAWIRYCDPSELDTLESMFIHQLRPEYNCTLPTGEKLAPRSLEQTLATARALVKRRALMPEKTVKRRAEERGSPAAAASTRAPGKRLLRLPEVETQTGLKKSSIYLRMSEGTFPRCHKLGGRTVAWSEEDVQLWITNCIGVARAGIEPASAP